MAMYYHPHMSFQILDQSQFDIAPAGGTMLFVVSRAEKGIDGVAQRLSGVNGFVDKFGRADAIKYGKGVYMMDTWLRSGGTGCFLRVMPEDALFSHTVIDIQTKEVELKRYEIDDEPVTLEYDEEAETQVYRLPDGTVVNTEADITAAGGVEVVKKKILVRPMSKVVYTTNPELPSGASTEDAIVNFGESLNGMMTEDGFTHHPVFAVFPNGRGDDYYSRVGFRLYLEDKNPDTFPQWRTYRIQFVVRDAITDGLMNLHEEPYIVSFDPTAMDLDGESMFITKVVEKYLDYKIRFNVFEKGMESLGQVLNPDVAPANIDFVSYIDKMYGDEEDRTDIHADNILAGELTTLSKPCSAGESVFYVNNPNVLVPGGRVAIGGAAIYTIQDVNLSTGKVTISSSIISTGHVAGNKAEMLVDDEYRQSVITETTVGSPTLTEISVMSLFDSESGLPIFHTGPAIFKYTEASVDEEEEVTIASIDLENEKIVLSAPLTLSESYSNIMLRQIMDKDSDGSEIADFDSEIYLRGGYDGTYKLNETETELLVKGYTGGIDSSVVDFRNWPIDIMFSAFYPKTVKDAQAAFASVIHTNSVFLCDLGTTGSYSQAIQARKDLAYNDWRVSLWGSQMDIIDPESQRRMTVPAVFDRLRRIPVLDMNNGIWHNFVGPERGSIDGFEPGSIPWTPDTPDIKEQLYQMQVNIPYLWQGMYVWMTQITSQRVRSALSDVDHARALCRIIRQIDKTFYPDLQSYPTKQKLDQMNYKLAAIMDEWRPACEQIDGRIYTTEYGRKMKTVYCSLSIEFRNAFQIFSTTITLT